MACWLVWLAGCGCFTNESRSVVERAPQQIDASCEEICLEAIGQREELAKCTTGLTDTGADAVICFWETEVCHY